MDTAWNLKWDYSAWKESPKSAPYMQRDWNQTLMTRINQVSAQIIKSSFRSSAETIHIHSDLYPIFQTLEYFHEQEMKLAGKYDVVIDNSLDNDKVYVSSQKVLLAEPFIIWSAFEGSETNEFDEQEPILKDPSKYTDSEIESYKRRLKGSIKITNYEKKMETAWNLEWDYLQWKQYTDLPYLQKDWNQTLITRINQISAQIHMACLRGGADTIYINSHLEEIFKTLEYYWPNFKIMSDRYKVVIDDSLEDVIYITNEKSLLEQFIPKTTRGESIDRINEKGQLETETFMDEVEFLPISYFTQEDVDEHHSKLRGKIIIKNYNPVI